MKSESGEGFALKVVFRRALAEADTDYQTLKFKRKKISKLEKKDTEKMLSPKLTLNGNFNRSFDQSVQTTQINQNQVSIVIQSQEDEQLQVEPSLSKLSRLNYETKNLESYPTRT